MIIYDKVALLISSTILYISLFWGNATVIPILIAITYSSLFTIINSSKYRHFLSASFCVILFFYSELVFFIPIIFYDMFFYSLKKFIPITLLITLIKYDAAFLNNYYLIGCFTLLSYLIYFRTQKLLALQKQHIQYQDSSKEATLNLEYINRELTENQDYEIHIATLNERNRIARDMHDHVGHMLSRCLLQVGALITVTKDSNMLTHLKSIQETLSNCMTCTRNSIHNLYDDSTTLYTEIQTLVDTFIFCPITLHYFIDDEVPTSVKYTFVAIVKEGLSNIIRHSSATSVTLTLRSHPTFYQLILHDNGNLKETITSASYDSSSYGIGLRSIHKRVINLKGTFKIYTDDGFKLFITIPKEAS